MNSTGAVFARIPAGGLEALATAVTQARAVSRHSSPLGILAGDAVNHGFALVDRWGPRDNMPMWGEGPDLDVAAELAVLSRLVGEVVAFYTIDEGLTMGLWGAWKNGTLARKLWWSDGRWEWADGEPQPWEKPLFAPDALESALLQAREEGRDEGEVRAAFIAERIAAGAAFPVPNWLSGHIRVLCRAPGWGFEPWPRRSEVVAQLPSSRPSASGRGLAK
ncbi:MAG: hypothetical protein GX442_14250 [Candidatus Riflebacteria bacterium]|nr:hypothetical protein [Candidatus Riflebacteria bacterium]